MSAATNRERAREYAVLWRDLVVQWSRAQRAASDARAPSDLLSHVLTVGLRAWHEQQPSSVLPAEPLDEDVALDCEVAVIHLAGVFDVARYRAEVREPRADRMPVRHYCEVGWRLCQNPSRDFDSWWYWWQSLDPRAFDVNPLVHYLLLGRFEGDQPIPPDVVPAMPEAPLPNPRRVCLVSGHDPDAVVDDYVVTYIQELSRHADVYYLMDGNAKDDELAKLVPYVRGAWTYSHGSGDFGAYSYLAEHLVGWEALAGYDELALVSDSAYLLRPLDEVFDHMRDSTCHWWGLVALRHGISEKDGASEPLVVAKSAERDRRPLRQGLRLHVAPEFVVLRGAALTSPAFRHFLGGVTQTRSSARSRFMYDIGLTRMLELAGFSYDTYLRDVYGLHALESQQAFEMVERGFPLLQQAFLASNPRRVPDLDRWPVLLRSAAPHAPVIAIDENLLRTAPDDEFRVGMSVRREHDGSISGDHPAPRSAFHLLDRSTPRFDHWWVFPVCRFDHLLGGNERAVFDAVRDDPSIKKIVLTRSRRVALSGENVEVLPLASRQGQERLARAGQVFVKHSLRANVPDLDIPTDHNIINLWHGIPLKRFGMSGHATEHVREGLREQHAANRAVIASSKVDALAMASAFYPLTLQHIWPTGLPRNDYVMCSDDQLPSDLQASEARLRAELNGRRLVLFVPTFKDAQAAAYYRFSDAEVQWLGRWCEANDAVIGIREHMADRARVYSTMLSRINPIDLSSREYGTVEMLYRVADALITDYSSALVDFMLTGRPVISFAYDHDRYSAEERGLFYDLDEVVPGPVCRDFESFANALERVFDPVSDAQREDYEWCRSLFFDHVDASSARRVVHRVKQLYVTGLR